MAKAALEAINGCNLFGDKGASWSVIFVDIDAHNRNRSIFETLLPRESSSKVSCNLLCITVKHDCKQVFHIEIKGPFPKLVSEDRTYTAIFAMFFKLI